MTAQDTELIGEKLRAAVEAELRGEVTISLEKQESNGCISTFRFRLVLRKMGTEFRCIASVALNEQMRTNPVMLTKNLDRISVVLARQCVADFVKSAKVEFSRKAAFN